MNRTYSKLLIFSLIAVGVFSCVPPSDSKVNNVAEQDFNNPLALRIYGLQQEQNLDSLLYFMESEDPMARFCATRAFGSFRTPKAIPAIRAILKDTVPSIKKEAVYVAGQLGDESLANDVVALFQADLSEEINFDLNKAILESIGKIGTETHLSFLSSSKSYPKEYTALNEGKAHAYYQFSLRGLKNPDVTKEVIKFATEDYSDETRMIAANYLLRTKELDLAENKFQLLQALFKEENPDVRMGLSAAVAKTGSSEIIEPFIDYLKKEEDYRVVINAVRNFGSFKYIDIIDKALSFLEHHNEQVASAAAAFLRNNGQLSDTRFYLESLPKMKSASSKLSLQSAVLGLYDQYYPRSRKKIITELENQYNKTNDPYEKREILAALGSNPYTYETIVKLGLRDSLPIVRSKATEVLGSILTEYLPSKGRSSNRYLGPIVYKFLEEAIASGDAGMISAAAYSLKSYDKTYLQRYVSDTTFTTAFDKLNFPKDLEPMQYLADVHNYYFPDNKISTPNSDTRRSYISKDFSKFDATYTAVVETDQGEIQFELLINDAPESVLNFIDLAEQDFFDNKVFHRVVPNFVIQTACPRGDGYGGMDYTIRSELSPLRYSEEGYVGMASAGNHTEGSQWFITHSPAPHLNGKYTIFGKVTTGMDVVKKMKVGTRINNVNIIDVPNL